MSNKYQNNCLQRTVLQRRGGTDKIMSEAMNSVFPKFASTNDWMGDLLFLCFASDELSAPDPAKSGSRVAFLFRGSVKKLRSRMQ